MKNTGSKYFKATKKVRKKYKDKKNYIKNKNKIKYFVEIPHSKLKGIKVVFINEAYTSIVSSIDLESINQMQIKKRITRGVFKTSKGIIKSDSNGSLNIVRKYYNYKNIPMLIKRVRDKVIKDILLD